MSGRQGSKEGLQKELLSNYYLQKYDTIMNKLGAPPALTVSNYSSQSAQVSGRTNFKGAILQRKYGDSRVRRSPNVRQFENVSPKKANFKSEVMEQNTQLSEYREQRRNLKQIEESIVKELYKPVPSQLEQGRFVDIAIRTSPQMPMKPIPSTQDYDSNVYIEEEDQELWEEPIKYEQEIESVKEAIRSSFFSRGAQTAEKSTTKSPSKQHEFQVNVESVPWEESKRKRPSRSPVSPTKWISPPPEQLESEKEAVQIAISESKKVSPSKVYFQRQQTAQELQFSSRIQIQGEVKSFPQISSPAEVQAQPQSTPIQKQKQVAFLQVEKESKHDFSMISRFSMSSDEAYAFKDKLEREINENQLGPYQSALSSLYYLIDESPHTRPIFTMGQRILDDRTAYQLQRKVQNNKMSEYKMKVAKLRKKVPEKGEDVIQRNKREILRLVRQLSTRV